MKFTENQKYKDNIILKLSFEFAVMVVRYSEELDSYLTSNGLIEKLVEIQKLSNSIISKTNQNLKINN